MAPLYVDMLARLTHSPIGSRRVEVVVVGLPYERWICRLAHPRHYTRRILPQMVLPALIHSLVDLQVEQLSLAAEILDALWLAVVLCQSLLVAVGTCVGCQRTEVVFVPHLVTWPPAILGHKLTEALEGSKHRCTYLCAEAPLGTSLIAIHHRVGCEIPARMHISPRATSRQALRVGYRLIMAVATIVVCHVATHPVVERFLGHTLVVATPHRYRGVVTQTLYLLYGVGVECVQVVWQVAV